MCLVADTYLERLERDSEWLRGIALVSRALSNHTIGSRLYGLIGHLLYNRLGSHSEDTSLCIPDALANACGAISSSRGSSLAAFNTSHNIPSRLVLTSIATPRAMSSVAMVPLDLKSVAQQLQWVQGYRGLKVADVSAHTISAPGTSGETGWKCEICATDIRRPKNVAQAIHGHNRSQTHLDKVSRLHSIARITLGDRSQEPALVQTEFCPELNGKILRNLKFLEKFASRNDDDLACSTGPQSNSSISHLLTPISPALVPPTSGILPIADEDWPSDFSVRPEPPTATPARLETHVPLFSDGLDNAVQHIGISEPNLADYFALSSPNPEEIGPLLTPRTKDVHSEILEWQYGAEASHLLASYTTISAD